MVDYHIEMKFHLMEPFYEIGKVLVDAGPGKQAWPTFGFSWVNVGAVLVRCCVTVNNPVSMLGYEAGTVLVWQC